MIFPYSSFLLYVVRSLRSAGSSLRVGVFGGAGVDRCLVFLAEESFFLVPERAFLPRITACICSGDAHPLGFVCVFHNLSSRTLLLARLSTGRFALTTMLGDRTTCFLRFHVS